jgi:glycosyltransferase involved in cell wall biosynthesis
VKVAHSVVVTPGRCGLYETTRELVASLNGLGVDSRLVDPDIENNPLHPKAAQDRSALIADMDWALSADVIVSHSGYETTALGKTQQPIVHVAHGRPHSTFIGEVQGGTSVYSYHWRENFNPRIRYVVTFWEQHVALHRAMFPGKLIEYIPSSVDLQRWSVNGPSGYKFGGERADINAVITDAWRDDVDQFFTLSAFANWARKQKSAKVHIFGGPEDLGRRPGWGALLRRIQENGNLGEIKGWLSGGLDNVYRAASFTLTPHVIDVRTIRESMACGCPVVSVPGPTIDSFPDDVAAALAKSRTEVREEAERRFNPAETARRFKQLLETI